MRHALSPKAWLALELPSVAVGYPSNFRTLTVIQNGNQVPKKNAKGLGTKHLASHVIKTNPKPKIAASIELSICMFHASLHFQGEYPQPRPPQRHSELKSHEQYANGTCPKTKASDLLVASMSWRN